MPTTSNFGWTTPADTDLVKDGAAAIRTLGNGVDASFVDLKGGTTGQVLSKNSNTDLDFTWVAQDDSNAIQNSIVDAKADLITATANDTPARLAVGNDGESLVADSSATTGLRWSSQFLAGKNKIINGAFDIWQRGTSSSTAGFLADRFQGDSDGTFTQSRQSFTAGAAPVAGYEAQYFYRLAKSGGTYGIMIQRIEDVRTFANQTVTLSFWAKVNSGTLTYAPTFIQNFGSGGSSSVTTNASNITLSTTWTRYSVTVSLPSISGKTIGTNSYLVAYVINMGSETKDVDIWGVQLEAGLVATPFSTATGTLAGELAVACRYYYRLQGGTNTAIPSYAIGVALSTTKIRSYIHLPAIMRTVPSVSYSGTLYFEGGATTVTVSSIGQTYGNSTSSTLMQDWNTTGATSGNAYTGWPAQATTNYIEYSSEL